LHFQKLDLFLIILRNLLKISFEHFFRINAEKEFSKWKFKIAIKIELIL